MRSISVVLLLLVSFAVFSQTGPLQIHLKSGRIVSTKYAYLYSSMNSYVRINEKSKKGEKFKIHEVDHIEGIDQNGKYRYFLPVRVSGLVWAEQGFTSDRIVVYHVNITDGSLTASSNPKYVQYSKDGGPLRPLKFKYLKKDMADCPASMKYISDAKKIAAAQGVLCAVSYSLIIAGFVQLADEPVDDPGSPEDDVDTSIPPMIIIGAVGAWIPYFMNKPKRERCLDALKAYK